MSIDLTAAIAAAERALRVQLFPTQRACAEALLRGSIVEMQTGEGKTLAAMPAAALLAQAGQGVHVLTANDYLARRDAAWMGPAYAELGLTVAAIHQDSTAEERRAAYAADVTYVARLPRVDDCRAGAAAALCGDHRRGRFDIDR
jgi:preprotein translocase subunit SecA